MDLKLDGSKLEELLHAAVLQAITPEAQAALLQEVVRYLTSSTRNTYNNRDEPSPLLQALRSAATRYAEKLITERFEHDADFKKLIESLYIEAFQKMQENREPLITRLSEKMADAITRDR